MTWSGRKLAGLGCGVLVVGAIVVAGALTWYSTQLRQAYRKVQDSEQALVAATAAPVTFAPPPDGVPAPGRLEAFAGVREATSEWRARLAAEDERFAGDHGRWWRRAGDAHDLAQVLAGFWLARNEALKDAAMGPGEYAWLYGLVYYGWLGYDPAVGRQPGLEARGGSGGLDEERFARWRAQWQGGVTADAGVRLEALRGRLAAGWTEATNPVELIFMADAAPTGSR